MVKADPISTEIIRNAFILEDFFVLQSGTLLY